MKNNIFGYLFFVFIIGIITFAIYKFNSDKEEVVENVIEGTSTISIEEKGTSMTLRHIRI